jgi:hypothetical protein
LLTIINSAVIDIWSTYNNFNETQIKYNNLLQNYTIKY